MGSIEVSFYEVLATALKYFKFIMSNTVKFTVDFTEVRMNFTNTL